MTPEEIHRLLGGYATNALSAEERRSLFEAALEDQELFNALQNEDTLRELLADPVSREQVRRALTASGRSKQRAGFWSWRWLFGVGLPAIAAVIVIVMMNRAPAPQSAPPVMTAMRQPVAPPIETREVLPKAESAASAAKKQAVAPKRIAPEPSPVPAPAPPAKPAPQLDAAPRAITLAAPALRANLLPPNAPIPADVQQQLSADAAAGSPLYNGPLVQYSLISESQDVNTVRLRVTPTIAGYLALYRVNAAGSATRIYPDSDGAARVLPNIAIQIPSRPIDISGTGEKLRLVMLPVPQSFVNGVAGGTVGGLINPAAQALPAPPTPLVIDIPLAKP